MDSEQILEAGRYYWAIPAEPFYAGPDYVQKVQPAMYVGDGKWLWFGCEDDNWPPLWVGDEISAAPLASPPQ